MIIFLHLIAAVCCPAQQWHTGKFTQTTVKLDVTPTNLVRRGRLGVLRRRGGRRLQRRQQLRHETADDRPGGAPYLAVLSPHTVVRERRGAKGGGDGQEGEEGMSSPVP